jgi:hypothetical protein
MPIRSTEWSAENVRLVAFRLPPRMVGQIGGSAPVPLGEDIVAGLETSLRDRTRRVDQELRVGVADAWPQVGDFRIRFTEVPSTAISVVARQAGSSFEPFTLQEGTIDMLRTGTFTAVEMFAMAQRENTILTWVIRGVGFLMMAIGIGMVLAPLSVAADVVPLVGNLLRLGTGLVAGVVGFAFSIVTIGVAWIAYRPLLGVTLLAAAVAALVFIKNLSDKKAPAPAASPDAPPPPPPPSP